MCGAVLCYIPFGEEGLGSNLPWNRIKNIFSSQSEATIFGRALNSLLFPHHLSVIILTFVILNKKWPAVNNGKIFFSQSEASFSFAS